MRTWIFQGNPDTYDIEGFLATRPVELTWLVTRYEKDVAVGDRVFLWRNQGKEKAVAGVIAEAEVVASAALRAEHHGSGRFWRDGAHKDTELLVRAILRLVRAAGPRQVIRLDWCKEDPILRDLANVKMASGTNFPVTPEQADRLAALWSRTGQDWTRDESVAGLWAYAHTQGGPVSKLPDHPVPDVALRIGRAVPGVYNKVMNFRFLDPRDGRKGMSGGSGADDRVWTEFYDPGRGELRLAELDTEYGRLWGEEGAAGGADPSAEEQALEAEARALEGENLTSLLSRFRSEAARRPKRPRAARASTRVFERSAVIVAIARVRAGHRCEMPNCEHPVFLCSDGRAYTEVHHIVPLGEGGEDTPENVACVCAAHHREAHVGQRAQEVGMALETIRSREVAVRSVGGSAHRAGTSA